MAACYAAEGMTVMTGGKARDKRTAVEFGMQPGLGTNEGIAYSKS